MMLALSVIVALVGGIALMGALSIGVIERTKEIGVLRAVGARSSTILGIFMMEGLLQGLMSWCIAAPLSLAYQPHAGAGAGKGHVWRHSGLPIQLEGRGRVVCVHPRDLGGRLDRAGQSRHAHQRSR